MCTSHCKTPKVPSSGSLEVFLSFAPVSPQATSPAECSLGRKRECSGQALCLEVPLEIVPVPA